VSSLWTPGGERPVPPPTGDRGETPPAADDPAEPEARMAELRQQLADAPAEIVVANHCFGLFELAALHLSLQPPRLESARLAIDGLGCIVEGLGERLGEQHTTLKDGLAQLRLAYVQIHAGQPGDG